MSPLNLRPVHRGQTSQGKCAQVAPPAFDPVNDIHESHGGMEWDMPILPDNSSSKRRREIILKCDTWSTSNLGFSGGVRSLPTIHQGRFRLSTNLGGGEGALPFSNPCI